jgi:hypothetical protein
MDMSSVDTKELLSRIEQLQAIQKRSRSTSAEWIEASNDLKPLFEEMAKRQRSGNSNAACAR